MMMITARALKYPPIGLFIPETKGILPLTDPAELADDGEREFRAATVTASITNFVDNTDPCIVGIEHMSVKLTEIELEKVNSQGSRIHAMVMCANLIIRRGEIVTLGYEVNVLERIPLQDDPTGGDFKIFIPVDANDPNDPNDVLGEQLLRKFHPRLLNTSHFNWNGGFVNFN